MTRHHLQAGHPNTFPGHWSVLLGVLRSTVQDLGAQGDRELRLRLGELRQAHLAAQARLGAFRAASVENTKTLLLDARFAPTAVELASGRTQT